jgi:acyl-CoA synthetase (AMP-forming)/AMP-acid ligase II
VVLLFICANLTLGITFSSLARNQLQAMQMTFFFFLPSILLSGFMFPFLRHAGWAQVVGNVLPLTHFLVLVRGILLKGNGIEMLWPHTWPILLFRQPTRPGGDRARLALQHHLFVRHHRHAQGHRAVARHALGPRHARRALRLRAGHRDAAVHAAVLQHHAGGVLPDAGLRRHRGADAQVRRSRLSAPGAAQRVTHTMLVPVQYQRLMARPEFDAHDLSALPHEVLHQRAVQCRAEGRRAETLARRLVEFYGMTEGGGTCILEAHNTPTSCTPWAGRPKATTSA